MEGFEKVGFEASLPPGFILKVFERVGFGASPQDDTSIPPPQGLGKV